MSFASKVLYTGDGVTTDFTVSMPYISSSHINVFVNQALQLATMQYVWSGASTISFVDAPADGAAIEIKRNTSPANILVDFVDGSTLRATDLDTAYLHNYYLTQEYADSFNEVINNALVDVATGAGIVETETDAVIAALVNEMLNTSAASELQSRIADIDLNAEAIVTLGQALQVQLNTLASGIAATVFIQAAEPVPGVGGVPDPIPEGARWYDSDDNNSPYIYQSSVWVSIEDPRIGNAVADISVLQTETGDNAAAIVAESLARTNADSAFASELALIGAQNAGQTAFVIDLNTAYVGPTESLAQRFTQISADWAAGDAVVSAEVTTEASARAAADSALSSTITLLNAEVDANAAAIVTEQTARASGDSANASSISALTTTVDGNTASISTLQTSVNGIETAYGVELNVNGYVQGFRIINGGIAGENAFVIMADRFAIVDAAGGPGETEYVPFEISGGKINMRSTVQITGDLLVSGTINGTALINGTIGSTQIGENAITSTQINADAVTADKILAGAVTATKINVTNLAAIEADLGSITAGNITLDTAGYIKGGQTAYNTGSGFFLGYETDAYKFSIGDGASNFIKWDGTELVVRGNVSIGSYVADATEVLLSAPTLRNSTSVSSYNEVKKFEMNRPGTIRVYYDKKIGSVSGGLVTAGSVRVQVDGSTKSTVAVSNTTFSESWVEITLSANDRYVTVEVRSGERNTSEPVATTTSVQNVEIRAIKSDGESVVTD